jgi:hypothetical protein
MAKKQTPVTDAEAIAALEAEGLTTSDARSAVDAAKQSTRRRAAKPTAKRGPKACACGCGEGWSESGQKECRIWIHPGEQPAVLGIERRLRPFHAMRPPIWCDDPSWVDLIAKSWAVESPFSGSVTLWPREDHEVKPGEGL